MLSRKLLVDSWSNLRPASITSSGTTKGLLWLSSFGKSLYRIFNTVSSSATLSWEPLSSFKFLSTTQRSNPGSCLPFSITFGISSGFWLTIVFTRAKKRSSGEETSCSGGTPIVLSKWVTRTACGQRPTLPLSWSTSPSSLLQPSQNNKDGVEERRLGLDRWFEDTTMEEVE